jgi:hypothetical protein
MPTALLAGLFALARSIIVLNVARRFAGIKTRTWCLVPIVIKESHDTLRLVLIAEDSFSASILK